MKKTLAILLLLAPAARAQVIECPKFYPSQGTQIVDTPYMHDGHGFIARAQLRGAGMYTGEPGGQDELQGDRRRAVSGWDVQHSFAGGDRKWLVCFYGSGEITW